MIMDEKKKGVPGGSEIGMSQEKAEQLPLKAAQLQVLHSVLPSFKSNMLHQMKGLKNISTNK